jgi:hypothetical protein
MPLRATIPPRVWKHYYALPSDIWKPDLADALPSQSSGVLLLKDHRHGLHITCWRQAKPARDAYRLTAEQAVNVARLASLRMWDAYQRIDEVSQKSARAA